MTFYTTISSRVWELSRRVERSTVRESEDSRMPSCLPEWTMDYVHIALRLCFFRANAIAIRSAFFDTNPGRFCDILFRHPRVECGQSCRTSPFGVASAKTGHRCCFLKRFIISIRTFKLKVTWTCLQALCNSDPLSGRFEWRNRLGGKLEMLCSNMFRDYVVEDFELEDRLAWMWFSL